MQRMQSLASSETRGQGSLAKSSGAFSTRSNTACSVLPLKGSRPHSRMYMITPALQMSASLLYWPRTTCAPRGPQAPRRRHSGTDAAGLASRSWPWLRSDVQKSRRCPRPPAAEIKAAPQSSLGLLAQGSPGSTLCTPTARPQQHPMELIEADLLPR